MVLGSVPFKEISYGQAIPVCVKKPALLNHLFNTTASKGRFRAAKVCSAVTDVALKYTCKDLALVRPDAICERRIAGKKESSDQTYRGPKAAGFVNVQAINATPQSSKTS